MDKELSERLVEYIIKHKESEDYLAPGDRSVCYGWDNTSLSPVSREAIIKKYGEQAVLVAESTAMIKEAKRFAVQQKTEWHKHAVEADKADKPTLNGWVFGVASGLKCDGNGGVFDAVNDCIKYKQNDKQLIKITSLVEVDAETFNNPMLALDIVQKHNPEGGYNSDDVDLKNKYDLTEDERKTIYTVGCGVVCEDGRWFVIDTEGYDYPRYIFLPIKYRDMFANEVECARLEMVIENQVKAVKKAEGKVSYVERCIKWEKLLDLKPIQPYIDKEKDAWEVYKKCNILGKKRDCPEYLAYNRAKQEALRVRKANVLAMCNHEFPDVKFKIEINHSWGSTHDLVWTGGPTEKEFMEKVDLYLFTTHHTTWNGMEDCTEVDYEDFTDFAEKYFDSHSDIDIKRYREKGIM